VTKLWGGRFDAEPAPELLGFTRSVHFDIRLVQYDCRVLAAHAHALDRAGLLDASKATDTLDAIAADIEAGAFPVDPSDEDVHTTVERALLEREPDLGSRIRAGLSRNDRVATAFRLWVADASAALVRAGAALRTALDRRAAEHEDTLMPGYTHLQRAQPVTLAYHLHAHGVALARAERRLTGAGAAAMKSCPLGAGALAGSTLALDRAAAAHELGFAAPAENTIDAVSDRDFVATFLFACAMLGVTCSRLAEEIVLWTTQEFGFASLDDAWSTGSSLMPQKRNPDVAELARGKTGRLIGDLTALLATLKGLPLAYNRDLQEDKEPAFDAYDTLAGMVPALAGMMSTLRFDTARLAEAAADRTLLATDLAEYLVAKGVPFREAHEAVGRLIRDARDPARVTLDEVRASHKAFGEDIAALLDAVASVHRRLAP